MDEVSYDTYMQLVFLACFSRLLWLRVAQGG